VEFRSCRAKAHTSITAYGIFHGVLNIFSVQSIDIYRFFPAVYNRVGIRFGPQASLGQSYEGGLLQLPQACLTSTPHEGGLRPSHQ